MAGVRCIGMQRGERAERPVVANMLTRAESIREESTGAIEPTREIDPIGGLAG